MAASTHTDTHAMEVVIKNSHIVKPAESITPDDEIMYVSDCDQVKPLTHAPTIYVYKPTTEISIKDAIHILKDSLSKALVTFYPLAGRLHWISGGGGRVELHCKSKGASVLEAESHLKIDDLGDFLPSPVISSLLPSVDLINTPIEDVPLLLVQLTKFTCGGLTLGVMISHVLADGRSALHFLSEWAKVARGGDKSFDPPPFLDRKVLQPKELPPHDALSKLVKHSQFHPLPPVIGGDADGMDQRKKPTMVAALKIGKEQVEKLKAKANINYGIKSDGEEHKSFRALTKFEALSAHIWKCASKARKHTNDQETLCLISVDFRNRLKQPLPPAYFGNAVVMVPAVATAGDILSKPLGYTASKIRETIDSVTDQYVNATLATCKNLPDVSLYRNSHTVGCSRGAFFGNPNILITSWTGLNLYGLDFGWGEETYLGPASVGYDGRILMLPSHNGDGSFLVILRFQVEHFDAFVKYFHEEI
uniref:Shikimate O-hydroxycinnamoyltransferase n=1 Tax=Gymnema sylvestre TaxID=4068 RepID=A0AA49BZX3_GYMSY|nr:shikimate O-hydroxycinnamoyltransferase [Gymnema sylvestre]